MGLDIIIVATEEFIELCAFEPYWRISELIAERIDVNAKGEYGWTALMYAAFRNDSKTIALLLQDGADVNLFVPNIK